MGIYDDYQRKRRKSFKIFTSHGSITIGNFNEKELQERLAALRKEGHEVKEVLEVLPKFRENAFQEIEI